MIKDVDFSNCTYCAHKPVCKMKYKPQSVQNSVIETLKRINNNSSDDCHCLEVHVNCKYYIYSEQAVYN